MSVILVLALLTTTMAGNAIRLKTGTGTTIQRPAPRLHYQRTQRKARLIRLKEARVLLAKRYQRRVNNRFCRFDMGAGPGKFRAWQHMALLALTSFTCAYARLDDGNRLIIDQRRWALPSDVNNDTLQNRAEFSIMTDGIAVAKIYILRRHYRMRWGDSISDMSKKWRHVPFSFSRPAPGDECRI